MTATEPVLFSVEGELESWADTLLRLPARIRAALEDGREAEAVRLLIAGGERRENWLTDVVFHNRRPDLRGRQIRPGEHGLAKIWRDIRQGIVHPALLAPLPAAPPVPPPAPVVPAAPARSVTDWRRRALEVATIDPAKWQPDKGFKHNKAIAEKVYAYYMRLFNSKQRELLWAGMAKLAGATVYGGLLDAQKVVDSLRVTLAMNPDLVSTLIFNTTLAVQKQLLLGQRAIFDDLAWQHQAYVDAGLRELEAHAAAGVNVNAWRDIASGDPDRVRRGNKALLKGEQEMVVAPFYAAIRALKDADQVPEQMSREAQSPIPGGRRFREVVPGGDLTVFRDRWKWIEEDMLPKYEALTPERRHTLVNHSLTELARRRFPPG